MFKKRQKSYVSAFLAFAVLAASPIVLTSAAHAEDQTTIAPIAVVAQAPTLSQDDAIQKARDLLGLSEDKWDVNVISLHTGQDPNNAPNGHPSYSVNFTQANSKAPAGYNVVIDGLTGKLLLMNHYDKTGSDTGVQTTDSLQAIAEAFVKKVAPDEFKQTELEQNPYQAMNPYAWTNFVYMRKANGLPVIGNQITVSVGPDGQIYEFDMNWTDATFPAPDSKTISMDQANQAYQKSLTMNLAYSDYFANNGTAPSIKLAYRPAYKRIGISGGLGPISNPIIDAKTGNTLGTDGQATTDINEPTPAPLVPNGPTTPASLDHDLTQAEAETLAQKSDLLPSDATLSDSSYQTMNGSKVWSLSYQGKTTNGIQTYYNIAFNVKTGEIYNFFGGKNIQPPSTSSLSNDQLLQKAIDLVKQNYPGRLGAVCAPNTDGVMKSNSFFQFPVLKNGITTDEYITVSLNPSSGDLMSLSINGPDQNFDKLEYPTTDGVVPVEQAKAVYMKHQPLELGYLFPTSSDGTRSTTPILVYTPTPSNYTDGVVEAKTGEWFNLYQSKQPNPTPSDIKGHWAEKVLTQFAQRGLLEMDGDQAHPDQQMTRAQFVRLLVDFKQRNDPAPETPTFRDVPADSKYYAQIETAVTEKWIAKSDQFNPGAKISREEAATILARAQGFSDLAKHKEIFKLPYEDANSVSSWAYGSVAIDYGLGLMRGVDATHFAPQATITLAQAATMLNQTQVPQS